MKRISFILIILSFSIFRSCAKLNEGPAVNIQSGGSAVIGILGNIAELFPYNINDYYGREISKTLLNPALTCQPDNGSMIPQLASAWSISKDKLHITYIINKNFRWSSGRRISAYDVKDTFYFLKDNSENFLNPFNYSYIDSVYVLDSLTVRFDFNQQVNDPLRKTRFAVLNSRQTRDNPSFEDFIKEYEANFIGLGPYLLEKKEEKNLVFKANKFFPGPGPYLDKIILKMYADLDSLLTALRKNKIDVVPTVPLSIFDGQREFENYKIKQSPSKGFEFIGWNLRRRFLKPIQIRKALTFAVDRPTIVDGVLGDNARVEDRPVLSYSTAEKKELELPYNPSKAEELLADQGWKQRFNKGYLTKNGKQFHLEIITNEENRVRKELALNIKGYYEALNIKVSLGFLPWNDLVKRLETGDFDAVIISWQENSPLDELQMYHSRSIESGRNFLAYSNKRADELIETALDTEDKNIRSQALDELQKEIRDDLPLTVICRQKMVHIASNKLLNVNMNRHSIFYNAPLWYYQENLKEQK